MSDCGIMIKVLFIFLFSNQLASEPAMKIEVLKEAPKDCQRKAKSGDVISMHYRGTLETNGNEFDSSYSRNQPFQFTLGTGMVIPGWEQGVPGMCVGEKRKLIIPPSLAYGDTGFGDIIPAKSTLVFEIELMNIKGDGETAQSEPHNHDVDEHVDGEEDEHHHEHPDSFEALDLNGNKEISVEEMTKYIKAYQEHENAMEGDDESTDTIVSEIFQEDDKNKDGVISYEEYMHSAGQYEDDGDFEEEDNLKTEL